jgi:hypothetical protein
VLAQFVHLVAEVADVRLEIRGHETPS